MEVVVGPAPVLTSPHTTNYDHASPTLSASFITASTDAETSLYPHTLPQSASVRGNAVDTEDRAATPVPLFPQGDTQLLQQHARQLALSRQKPFSTAKESTQILVISRLFAPVVEFVKTKLQEMGRVIDGPVDVGHVLQRSSTLWSSTAEQCNKTARTPAGTWCVSDLDGFAALRSCSLCERVG